MNTFDKLTVYIILLKVLQTVTEGTSYSSFIKQLMLIKLAITSG